MAFQEGGWAGRGQGNFLSLGWETILEEGCAPSCTMAWRCGKETEILPYYYFHRKDPILHQERRGQVKTIVTEHFNDILFHNLDPLISSIPINQSGTGKSELRTAQVDWSHSCTLKVYNLYLQSRKHYTWYIEVDTPVSKDSDGIWWISVSASE